MASIAIAMESPPRQAAAQRAGTAAAAPGIWDDGDQHRLLGKTKKRFLIGIAAVGAAAFLALGLFFGLSDSEGGLGGQINAQSIENTREQMDHNSLGCFLDNLFNRTMVNMDSANDDMTPNVS